MKLIQNHSAFPRMKEQAEKIKERINKYGVVHASVLFFVGKKYVIYFLGILEFIKL